MSQIACGMKRIVHHVLVEITLSLLVPYHGTAKRYRFTRRLPAYVAFTRVVA